MSDREDLDAAAHELELLRERLRRIADATVDHPGLGLIHHLAVGTHDGDEVVHERLAPAAPKTLEIRFEGMEPGLAIFTAAGRILRAVEELPRLDELEDSDLLDAAGELRAAFDRWIPGWDSPEAGASLN